MAWFRRDEQSERRPEELIPRLCRESGRWLLVGREGDRHWVRATDHRPVKEILIRCRPGGVTALFQAWLSVRFPLDNPPSGLFGRLLLRNMELRFAAWGMVIGESCEACPTVQAPRSALDATLFDTICREIRDEILGFQAELHEKFRYSAPTPFRGHDGGQPEVRYIEPVPDTLPSGEAAWRMLRDQAGTVRYRLPGPGE